MVELANRNSIEVEESAQVFMRGFTDGASGHSPRVLYIAHETQHISKSYLEGYEGGREARVQAFETFGKKIGYDFSTSMLREK